MMKRLINKRFLLFILPFITIITGCSSTPYLYKPHQTIEVVNDTLTIDYPISNEYEEGFYYYNSLFRRPIINSITFKRTPRSGDVNSMDHLPRSSWFTPRLGYRDVSANEILHGPEMNGSPELPFVVSKVKDSGSNPGFLVKDQRGFTYMLKFDVPGFEGIQTTTDFIVSRLFWSFGYNVPEDYQLFLNRADIKANLDKRVTEEDIDRVLAYVPQPDQAGRYRSTASQFIEGSVLGPTSEEGVRKGDYNDYVPHEERRTLRALKSFCSFLNHSGIRVDNSLDTYIGEKDNGYVKHYLIDFGEAFGGHGAEHEWLWDGYRYRFQFKQMFINLFSLGLITEDWEYLEMTPYPSVGAFESKIYDPAKWNETYQYLPIQRSQPDDNYWAVKILMALKEEHLNTLIQHANYPDPGASEYMLNTLLERKDKTIRYYLSEVTPVEITNPDELIDSELNLYDLEARYLNSSDPVSYRVEIQNKNGEAITVYDYSTEDARHISLPIGKVDQNYLIIDLVKIADHGKLRRPAQIHLYRDSSFSSYNILGITH